MKDVMGKSCTIIQCSYEVWMKDRQYFMNVLNVAISSVLIPNLTIYSFYFISYGRGEY